jgi:CheY-like chemotaxis protein
VDDIRILIIEEDPTEQFALSELVHDFDYLTDFVSSIDEALNYVAHTKYVAVLINTQMQTVDGFACAESIREYERLKCERVPIIGVRTAVEAYADAKKTCVDRGMDDVLLKPYSSEELRQSLLRWAYQRCNPNMKLVENPSAFGWNPFVA